MPIRRARSFNYRYLELGELCFYCGEPGEVYDHCPPVSCAWMFPELPKLLIPACHECNKLLGGSYKYATLTSRVARVVEVYKKRYDHAWWTFEELKELGPGMQAMVVAGMEKRYAGWERVEKGKEVLRMLELRKQKRAAEGRPTLL